MQDTQGIIKPYRTIRADAATEQTIQKSRFIGQCYVVSEEAQAAETLERVRKRYWDATHNCYAYRIGSGGAYARSSDDGEPSGTAGAPILNVLTKLELVNVLCVVTRYFGGVLLGAGGLIRAYSGAAAEAAKQAGVVTMQPCTCLTIALSYAQYAALEKTIRAMGEIENIAYTETVTVKLWVMDEQVEATEHQLIDASDGRAAVRAGARMMRPASAEKE